MSDPRLSVVVASVNGLPGLARCLQSLTERAPEAEVIVADWTNDETRRGVLETWPSVHLISFDAPTTVPELRAAGIARASAPYVAVIEDHCVVEEGWSSRILSAHLSGCRVVGGSIRNGATARTRDWAAFFCEYSEHMEPAPAGTVQSLPGMNVSYDRSAIDAMADLLREGCWETWLHPHLLRSGFELHSESDAVLSHVQEFGIREFVSQRYHYSRSHAGMRNAELGSKRLLYAAGSAALVPLLYFRIARNVLTRRRHRREFLLATPLILFYVGVWAFGEAVGYCFGGGRSLLRVR